MATWDTKVILFFYPSFGFFFAKIKLISTKGTKIMSILFV